MHRPRLREVSRMLRFFRLSRDPFDVRGLPMLVPPLVPALRLGLAVGFAGCTPGQSTGSDTTEAGEDSSATNPSSGDGGVAGGEGAPGRSDGEGSPLEGGSEGTLAEGGDARTSGTDAAVAKDARASDGGKYADSGADSGGSVAARVRWVGRVDASNPNAVKFAWSGAGFVATVSGAKISVQLQTEGTTAAFFQPVIDGTAGPRFQVMSGPAQTVVLGSALAASDHTVELYRESEGMYGDDIFSGFVDGTLKGAPAASGRLIEIVGDSISAGYGNLGTEIHPPWNNTCTFSLDTESAYQAYGSMIGRALNAEVSIVARSGWGMYRDLGGSTTGVLSSVYESAVGTQNTSKWDFKRQANVVVINLGTNDSGQGDPGQPYEDAYVAFLHTVRGHYPNAWVFLTIGPMTSDPLLTQMRTHINNVVTSVADAKINAVNVPTQDATMTGCDYHPNVAEDKIMADALTTAIKTAVGW